MKILLVADIGGFPKGYTGFIPPKNYYHVGDEAMFLSVVRWYQKYRSEYQLTAFSWKNTYQLLGIAVKSHYVWPTKRLLNRLYFLFWICKLFLIKLFGVSFMNLEEKKFVQIIQDSDLVHFTGGGNITSFFPVWTYYSFFIIICAKLFGKKIILTSQSIGPFNKIDRAVWYFIRFFISFIGLRNPVSSQDKKIGSMIDSAYYLSDDVSFPSLKRKKEIIRIGLSIHPWNNYNEQFLLKLILSVMKTLSRLLPLTVFKNYKNF